MGAAAGEGPAAGPGAGAGGRHPGSGWRGGRRAAWARASPGRALPCPARLSPAPPQEGKLDRSSPYIQVLEEDWRQALRDHQQQANTIFALRKDLRQAEALRARVRSAAGDPGLRPSQEGGPLSSAPPPYLALAGGAGPGCSPTPCPLPLPPDGQARPLVWAPGAGRA